MKRFKIIILIISFLIIPSLVFGDSLDILESQLNYISDMLANIGKQASMLFAQGGGPSEDISQGLVGHWEFNEGSGTTASDSSGNGNNGILNGPAWAQGIFERALEFDGTNDYVNVGSSSVLKPGNSDFSAFAWIKCPDTGTASDTIISDRPLGAYGTLNGWLMSLYSDGGLWIVLDNGSSNNYKSYMGRTSLNDNQWHHVGFTWDNSSDTLKLYVDGKEDAAHKIYDFSLTGDTISNSSITTFGRRSTSAEHLMNGLIDEVRIYNRVLLQGEIDFLSKPPQAPPVAYDKNVAVAPDPNTSKTFILDAYDVNNDPLTYTIVTPPSRGELTPLPTEPTTDPVEITYSPGIAFTENDSFTFKVNDGTTDSNTATVSLNASSTELIGHWKFDEESGTTAFDSSGNGNNGRLAGGPVWTQGRERGALLFDGNNDSVVMSDINAFEFKPNEEFTISLWFMPIINKTGYIVGKYPSYYWHAMPSFRQYWTWNLYLYNSQLLFTIADGANHNTRSFYTITPGEWCHIAVSVGQELREINFYVNGLHLQDKTITRTIGQLTQNADIVRIGGLYTELRGREFDSYTGGLIDDVRIYNRALGSVDIENLARASAHRITIVAEDGGSITPKGSVLTNYVLVPESESITFRIIPDDKYEIKNVLVDGASIGAIPAYTFSGVTEDRIIKAEFRPASGSGIPEGWRPVADYNRDKFKPFEEKYNFHSVQAMVKAIRAEGHPMPTGHPRVFINNTNKEALRQKIMSNPGLMSIMQEAVNFAHQYYNVTINDNIPKYSRETKTQPVILADGIIYQLGRIPGINYYNKTPQQYGQDGVRHLMSTLNLTSGWGATPTPGGYYGHIPYYGPPLGYDWLYELMTAGQKETIGQLLLQIARPADGRVETSPPGSKLLGALVVNGDGIDDEKAEQLLDLFYKGLVFGDSQNIVFVEDPYNFASFNIFAPEAPGQEGFVYSWGRPPIYHFLEVWYDQTGEDYFKLPFCQNWVYQAIHSAGNNAEFSSNWCRYSDFTSMERGHRPSNLMLMSAIGLSRTNPTAAKLAAYYRSWNSHYKLTEKMIYMLRSDPAIRPQSPSQAGLDETAHFRGINRILSRNSWDDPDSTWLWFQGPTWTNIRNGGPVNELMLWKNGGMLIGKHGGQSHDYHGGNRTSTLVLYDETQPGTTYILKNIMDNAGHYGLGINLGEGASLTQLNKNLSGYHEGLRYFEEEPNEYLYGLGDGSDGFFHSSRLQNWSRQLVWFKSADKVTDNFVMLDRIKTASDAISAHVPLHLAQNPSIRNKNNNQDLGEGNAEPATDRFIRTSIGGVIYYSLVDDEQGITIEFIDPHALNSPLSVSVVNGKAVTVSLGTNSSGRIITTNEDIYQRIKSGSATNGLITAQPTGWLYYENIAKPTKNGPIALTGGKGIWKYENMNANRIVVTNNYDTSWGTAHGRLFVDTLLPENPVYYRMGGIETRNMDLFGNLNLENLEVYGSEDDIANISKGLYKVQIAWPDRNQDQLFLNTMQATDSSVQTPQETTLLQGANIIGACTGNNIALFNNKEGYLISGEVVMPSEINGNYKVLIADLEPGALYDITLNRRIIRDNEQASEAATIYLGNNMLSPNDSLVIVKIGTPPPPSTLYVSLSANPSSGDAPLNNVSLSANVSGTATGNINYTFYCNRNDTGTDVTIPYDAKYDNDSRTSLLVNNLCNYSNPGTYTAKVITERGALSSEDRATITVIQSSQCKDQDEDGILDYDADNCPEGKDICIIKKEELELEYILDNQPVSYKFKLKYKLEDDSRELDEFEIELENTAKIYYLEFLDLLNLLRLNPDNGCFTLLNLDNIIDIDTNRVNIDTSQYTEFNKKARITFYNITLGQPIIKKDGQICREPECRVIQYDRINHTLTIEVSGFSNIELDDNLLNNKIIINILLGIFFSIIILIYFLFDRKDMFLKKIFYEKK